MAKNEKTSKRVGKIASQQLRSKTTSKKAKSTAASALTQRPDKKKRNKQDTSKRKSGDDVPGPQERRLGGTRYSKEHKIHKNREIDETDNRFKGRNGRRRLLDDRLNDPEYNEKSEQPHTVFLPR